MKNKSNYEKFLNWCEDKWTREYKMKRILSRLYDDDIDFLKEQLRADMVDMLEEIKKEIEELKLDYPAGEYEHPIMKIKTTVYKTKTTPELKHDCAEIIQQKIEQLKKI